MRVVFTTGKDTLDILNELQKNCDEGSQSAIVTDSIHFLYQVETLMDAGFRFAMIDPSGKQYFIGKEREEDESESN